MDKLTFRQIVALVIALAVSLVALMAFQSYELLQEQKGRNRAAKAATQEAQALKDANAAIKQLADNDARNQRFFDLVGQLILVGNAPQSAVQRQVILGELSNLLKSRQNGTSGPSGASGRPQTTGSGSTTTTTAPGHPGGSQGPSPPPSSPQPPPPSTIPFLPPLPTLPCQVSRMC